MDRKRSDLSGFSDTGPKPNLKFAVTAQVHVAPIRVEISPCALDWRSFQHVFSSRKIPCKIVPMYCVSWIAAF
jgi:hypothetical protein